MWKGNGMERWKNVLAYGLCGLTVALITWMFEVSRQRTVWENRYVLAVAGILFLFGAIQWVRILLSFTYAGEKAKHVQRRRARRQCRRQRILSKLGIGR